MARRIAVVVQRYGEEVSGGAELHARWLAERLLALGEVHAITTCALDYRTWENYYAPGDSVLNGIRVHRFPVDRPRDWPYFQKLSGRLFHSPPSLVSQLEWLQEQGPLSTPLLNYIDDSYHSFDAFIFFTYLYAPTVFGLPLVADRAILVPTAHDEPYLYLPVYRSLFHLPHTIVYNTPAEKELVNRVTRNDARKQDVIAGIGINVPPAADGARFRQEYAISEDFILYVGRVDEAKNVPELFAYFQRYRAESERPLKLILIGKGHLTVPSHPDIIHLGFLPEQAKFDAMRAASVFVIPSLYESLSMVTLEAWLMGTPVLANGRCDVLKSQCRASNGGLYYLSYEEFAATLSLLLDEPNLGPRLGQQGRRFARAHYDWDVILNRYRAVLQQLGRAR